MQKTRNKHISLFFITAIYFFFLAAAIAQEKPVAQKPLISYLHELEKEFNIKFSFVDEDIKSIYITTPKNTDLESILTHIKSATQLDLKKLNQRYYSIFKSATISICGLILDNFETAIPATNIEILNTNYKSKSNLKGYFSINNIPREAILRIKHPDYKTKYIHAENLILQPCTSILLSPNYQQLDEVVVIQFLTTGLTKEKDASIQINTKDFGIIPGLIEPDILQTVQALPGVKSTDETVSNINIRGGTNDQNLILWDGIKMYQSGHFFGLISAFNPYLTDKVTLIKNGSSAQYGDGVSGIMLMETNDRIQKKAYGGAGFNLISGDFYGQFPFSKKLALQFSARRAITDFLDTPIYNKFSDKVFQNSELNETITLKSDRFKETFYFYDFTAKVLYDINSKHQLRISFINSNNNLDYTESNEGNTRNNHSKLDQTNTSIGTRIKSNWSSSFSSSINTYATRYNLNSLQSTPYNEQQLFQQNNVLETALQLHTNYTLSKNLKWLNGYHFNEVGITNSTNVNLPPFNSNLKGVIRTHALFSEINYTPKSKRINAIAGFRFNNIENINNTFKTSFLEPRININYKITKKLDVQLLGEYKNQITNQVLDLKQNFLGIEKRRWVLADGEILPITKSKQISLGFNYNKKNLYLGIEGFYKQVNGISTATQGFENLNQFNGQIGKYDIKGIEFLINKKTNAFSTWFSYAFNTNNYRFNDIIPQTFPNNLDIRHTITFASTYTLKKIKLGFGINYKSGKPYTQPLEENSINTTNFPITINYKEANSSRLPNYIRADASAIYSFLITPKIKATAGASIINMFGRKNLLNIYYKLNDEGAIDTVENSSLGVTPNLSFRVHF